MIICPVCGCSFNTIVKMNFKIGCPECYYVFEKEITQYYKTKNIQIPYTGSLPKRLKGYKSALVGRIEAKLKLEEAVKNEEYEKAALYRDYLKALNNPRVMDGEDSDNIESENSENKNEQNQNEMKNEESKNEKK